MILWMIQISNCKGFDNLYEDLLIEADSQKLLVKEKPLKYNNGRIKGNRVAIRNNMSSIEKGCTLAEELGHHYTSSGDILNLNDTSNCKQEYTARLWAYNKLVGLAGIIKCFEQHCSNRNEMAEHLNVTEEFLDEAIECYTQKYSPYVKFDNYIIYFAPNLAVLKVM